MSRASRKVNPEVQDLVIAGCRAHVTFRMSNDGCWIASGTVRCGLGENSREQAIMTDPCDSREEAERSAMNRIHALLGEQMDRSHSRVRNWSDV